MPAKIPGEFVPLDVNYAHDRAIRQAGPMAELLFIRAMTYARRMKTSGYVPDYDLEVIGVGIPKLKQQAEALVRVRLWAAAAGGWKFRSWDKWNPVSDADRQVRQSKGGRLGNHNRWHVDGVASDDCEFCIGGAIGTDSVTDIATRSLRIAEVEEEKERETDETHHSSSLSHTRAPGAVR